MVLRRRTFLCWLGTAALVCASSPSHSQQTTKRVIGFLSSVSQGPAERPVAGFQQGLQIEGFTDGQNLAVEYRWADGHTDRLPGLVTELLQKRVEVIVATGGGTSALAAKAATSTIPIVFSAATDPVNLGLVASLNRPGGNVTGVHVMTNLLEAKRLGLLNELIPNAATIGVLVNPDTPGAASQLAELKEAARALNKNVQIVEARDEQGIETAMAELARLKANSLLVAADPFFYLHHRQLIALAARYAMPAMYEFREYALGGGLTSYGISLTDAYRQVGIHAGRILKGAKPADLPVMQPMTFELVINLKTARSLGITVPPTLLARADEVIE
jgi:putative ABC transport system substrate-binding protein